MTTIPPRSIKLFEILWFVSLPFGLLGFLSEVDLLSRASKLFETSYRVGVFTGLVLEITLVLFISRRRRNWAKWTLTILYGFGIFVIVIFGSGEALNPFSIITACLRAWAIYLLFVPASINWLEKKSKRIEPNFNSTEEEDRNISEDSLNESAKKDKVLFTPEIVDEPKVKFEKPDPNLTNFQNEDSHVSFDPKKGPRFERGKVFQWVEVIDYVIRFFPLQKSAETNEMQVNYTKLQLYSFLIIYSLYLLYYVVRYAIGGSLSEITLLFPEVVGMGFFPSLVSMFLVLIPSGVFFIIRKIFSIGYFLYIDLALISVSYLFLFYLGITSNFWTKKEGSVVDIEFNLLFLIGFLILLFFTVGFTKKRKSHDEVLG